MVTQGVSGWTAPRPCLVILRPVRDRALEAELQRTFAQQFRRDAHTT
jgi:hypothetical protein